MAYKVTIADIAAELAITPATVSRALNNHPGISEETRKKVIRVAEKLNYRPNKIASSLRSGRSHFIGVLIPSAKISFFGSVVHGIEAMANRHGYNILIYQTNESRDYEIKGIETFLRARVDGILASIAKETLDYSHFSDLKKEGIPLVFFDRANDDLGIPSVVVNDYQGAFIATEHLLHQGYTQIAHIAGPQHIKIFNDRLRGYMAALQANDLPVREEWIYPGNVSIEAGRSAVRHMFANGHHPDAVFAVEDFTALGALKELKMRGVNIPTDFGVVGFANEMFGEHITPGLSSIDQQTVKMGEESFRLLLKMISGSKKLNEGAQRKLVLDPIPVFRQSSIRRDALCL